MAPMRHISTFKSQNPSKKGIVRVKLEENFVVWLTPKEGDENFEAIRNYDAWAYIYRDNQEQPAPLWSFVEWEPSCDTPVPT